MDIHKGQEKHVDRKLKLFTSFVQTNYFRDQTVNSHLGRVEIGIKIESGQPDIPGLEQQTLRPQPAIFSWVVMDLEMTSGQ